MYFIAGAWTYPEEEGLAKKELLCIDQDLLAQVSLIILIALQVTKLKAIKLAIRTVLFQHKLVVL